MPKQGWVDYWMEFKDKHGDDPQGKKRHFFKGKESGTVKGVAKKSQRGGKKGAEDRGRYQKWNDRLIEPGKK